MAYQEKKLIKPRGQGRPCKGGEKLLRLKEERGPVKKDLGFTERKGGTHRRFKGRVERMYLLASD